jgi:hypothetical protein
MGAMQKRAKRNNHRAGTGSKSYNAGWTKGRTEINPIETQEEDV